MIGPAYELDPDKPVNFGTIAERYRGWEADIRRGHVSGLHKPILLLTRAQAITLFDSLMMITAHNMDNILRNEGVTLLHGFVVKVIA